MEKENASINLLGDKGNHTTEILLTWALYVGRLLVIITEVLALAVFISRFSLDRQLIDLSDTIKKQQAFVEYFKQGEITYRKTQLKLSVSKANIASSSATVNFYNELMQKDTDQLTITSLDLTPTGMVITAQAASIDILQAFTQDLKQHPLITSLSIDKVDSKPKSALISITISAQLKKKK